MYVVRPETNRRATFQMAHSLYDEFPSSQDTVDVKKKLEISGDSRMFQGGF